MMDSGGNNQNTTNNQNAPLNPRLEQEKRKRKIALKNKEEELKKKLRQIEERMEVERVRKEGLNNFYFFCKKIMGFKDLYEPLHKPLCDFISNTESKRKLLLIPRGHFKTTIGSICYPIWKLLRNTEERIALMSVTSDLAEDNLRELVMKIDDPRTQSLYGNTLPPSKTWPLRRQFEYRCPRRGAKVGPSLYSCGVESSETGRHFSTIIIDDMVNDANTRSRDQLEKIWDWFGRQESVLDSDGEFVVIGTRWHWGDPYGKIEKLEGWEKMILSAIDDQGKVIFPTLFSKKKLADIRRTQGDYRYSCFYENNPSGAGLNPFDPKRFSWVDYNERDEEAYRYILVDPATTTHEWSHPTGIIIGDALPNKTFVIVEAIREKLAPDDLVAKVLKLCRHHNPREVVVESDSAHTAFVSWLRQQVTQKEYPYYIKEVKNPVRIGKETRTINTLQPRMHNGEVVLAVEMKGRDMLIEEFQSFPKGKTDDLIMALASVYTIGFPRSHERPKRKEMNRRTQIFNHIIAKGLNGDKRKRAIPRTRMNLWA